MPYEYKKPEEEEEVKDEGTVEEGPVVTGQQKTIEGGGGGTTEQGAMAQAGAQAAKPMADIGKYLDINRQKAQELAGKVGGVITGDITQAQTGLEQSGTKFGEQVQAGTVGMNQELFEAGQAALTNPNATTSATDYLAQRERERNMAATAAPTMATSPTGAVSGTMGGLAAEPPPLTPQAPVYNAGDAKAFIDKYGADFAKQYNAMYGGPMDIQTQEYFRQAVTDKEKALRTAKNIESATGRQELIARALADRSGRFSKGALALDQALLAGDVDAFKALQTAATPAQELAAKRAALEALAAEQVAGGKKTTEDTRKAFRDEFDIAREEKEIDEAVAKLQSQQEKDLEAERKKIGEIQRGENIDPFATTAYKPTEEAKLRSGLSRETVAGKGDIERLRALTELTGKESTFGPGVEEKSGTFGTYLDTSKIFVQKEYDQIVADVKAGRLSREAAEKKAREAAEEAAATAKGQATGAAVGATAGAIVGSIVPGVGTAVGAVVGGVVGGAIGGAICFAPHTEVTMKDGSIKEIKDLVLGDETFLGGKIVGVQQHLFNDEIFSYSCKTGSIYVTGTHAVFENNKWTRVFDSQYGVKIPTAEVHVPVVYSVSTEKHRLYIKGNMFADYDEVDSCGNHSLAECLDLLNKGL
jgi:hypothetical protein